MLVRFTKMHGLGNDFVVLDLISQRYRPTADDMRAIGNRNFGIGCDQILLVEAPSSPDNDFKYRIFNADGGEVEQCGNGARCFAKYVRDKGLIGKKNIRVETAGGIIELHIEDNDDIRVDMGAPIFEAAKIPFQAEETALQYALTIDEQSYNIGAVSMGNPHAILRVDDIDTADVASLGPKIEQHPRFPNRVNAGFMQVLDRQHIRLRVFERGAGETLACGTGACAAAVHGIQQGWLDSPVTVQLPGGKLSIAWRGEKQHVEMTGPASHVFEGKIRL
jgi:diaminopimelate epimerase